jgi:hypothetical protein
VSKLILTLYIVCFPLYILFSRRPDYFDGELTKGTIHFANDSTKKLQPYAVYSVDEKKYLVNAAYLFKHYNEGETVSVIYETSQPEKGGVYSVWGYWLRWGELLFSILLLLVMYRAAVAITSNPTPESLIEQLEDKPVRKRKYGD